MIPAIIAQSVLQQALASKPTAGAATAPTRPPAGQCRSAEGGGSIAGDLGKLSSDTLSLLGLGNPAPASTTTAPQAAKAYASTGGLGR